MRYVILLLISIISFQIMAQQKALVIIDIQNDYFEGGKFPLVGSEQAVGEAKKVLEYFRKENLPIIHIQHISDYPGATFFIPETEGVEIHKELTPLDGELVLQKQFPNSFIGTGLEESLKEKGITELVICGMMTSMCVDATTRAAKDLGYTSTLIHDACAAPNLEFNGKVVPGEDVHTAFLAALNYFYATLVSADEFVQ